MLVCDFLTRATDRFPDRPAVIFNDNVLDYAALAQRVGGLAGGLKELGVKPGDFVALLMPNHLEFTTSYLALMFAGAVAVPVNPLLKGPEILHILRDSGARAVITVPPFVGILKGIAQDLPELRHIISAGGSDVPGTVAYEGLFKEPDLSRPSLDPDAVAVCLYTSGTTGKPKGVLLTHDNLVFDTEAVTGAVGVDHRERYLGALPFYHAFAGTVCILAPVCTGASVVIVERFMPQSVIKIIKEHRVTIFPAVPAMYAAILAAAGQTSPEDLSSLRMLVSGGSAMPLEMMRVLEEQYGVAVLEGNGPTETSPISYVNRLEKRKAGSVGPPLPGVDVMIADDQDRELPRETVGEILVRGRNVMKGYLNQPQATSEAMRNGWFHTGDLGYMDEDNYVYIVDRKKDMIIVSGFNVYPREVEEVLYSHPKVAMAAVVGVPDDMRGEAPKAFVVLKEGENATEREIIKFCRERLANYKCPRRVEFRTSLPLNANGKVLKRALKEGLAG